MIDKYGIDDKDRVDPRIFMSEGIGDDYKTYPDKAKEDLDRLYKANTELQLQVRTLRKQIADLTNITDPQERERFIIYGKVK